jgi:adenylate kinase
MSLFFLGGVHGAGKTALAKALAPRVNGVALSASQLIRAEGVVPSTPDKRVIDIDANQRRLLQAMARYQPINGVVILDGHYCLRNALAESEPIPLLVFQRLTPRALLLLAADPEDVVQRLSSRDAQTHEITQLTDLMACEQTAAERVSAHLGIPLKVLRPPKALDDAADFVASIEP